MCTYAVAGALVGYKLPRRVRFMVADETALHTERGRKGLEEKWADINRFLWKTWSPSWSFDDDAFEQTAVSFDNPDFVDVVIHSYRHRYGVIVGDPAYAEIEAKLARQPVISVPSIVLLGADDGVDPPPPEDEDARKSDGFYDRRISWLERAGSARLTGAGAYHQTM